ncbi:hypothetical protein CBM2599_B50891 [Cupriavidus taiwanensis]|nr:hypothetical protein CBM2600_B10098 [Cupriavidus taiwanensis]SOY97145.1 hypothetical protein CBM2599_B50891 [Cupriavidus taiwanensis]
MGRGAVRLSGGAIVAQFYEPRHQLRQIWRSYVNQVIQAIRHLQPCLRGACRHSPARCRCTAHRRYRIRYG